MRYRLLNGNEVNYGLQRKHFAHLCMNLHFEFDLFYQEMIFNVLSCLRNNYRAIISCSVLKGLS